MHRRAACFTVGMLMAMTLGLVAEAQSATDPSVDFVVTPSRLEIRAEPGRELEVSIQVYNRSPEPLTLDTYVEDIEIPVSDLIAPSDLAFTASRWIEFVLPEVAIGPAGQGEAILRVDIPDETPSGGYHAFAFLQSRPDPNQPGLVPSGRIGVTLLLEVSPTGSTVIRSGRVSEMELSVEWSGLWTRRVVGSTTFDNTGEAHVVAGGLHTYRSWPGSTTSEQKVGPATTLRGTRHSFVSSPEKVPLFGKITLTSELVYQVTPDDLPVILTQETLWIVPWRLLSTIAVAVLAAGLIYRLNRRHSKREKAEPSPIAEAS